MGTYAITDGKTGRVFRVTGDSPPTDEEAAAIVAAHPAKTGYPLGISRAEEALNGLTLGWGDESLGLGAGLASVGSGRDFAPAYDAAVKRVRGDISGYEKDRPIESTVVNLAGSSPLMLAGGLGVAAKAGTAARLLQAAKAGAAIGGVSGAGNAEGDLSSRVSGGITGAALGSLAAPALTLAAVPMAAGLRLGFRGVQSASKFADDYVARALARDSVDATTARSAAASGRSLADLGGDNVVEAAEQAALSGPGRGVARKFYDARNADREGKISDAIKGTVSDQSMYEGIDAASAQQQADAAPLYDRAYSASYKRTPKLIDLSTRPAMGGAARSAMNQILNDPSVDQQTAREAFSKVFGPNYESLDDAALSRNLTQAMGSRPVEFRALDYMKRGLDDLANQPSASRSIRDLRTAWREELKNVNPSYQDALNAWAGPARLKEAYEVGRGFSSMDPEELTKTAGDYGPSEMAALRSGAARDLLDSVQDTRTGRGPVTTAQDLTKNTRYLQRVQALLGDSEAGAQKVLGRSSWKPDGNGNFANSTAPGQTIEVSPDGSWVRTQSSKSGKSTSILQRGAGLPDLEASVTGRPAAASPKADLNSLLDVAQQIVGSDARETQILKGSPTMRRAAASDAFDQVSPAIDVAAGGKLGLLGMASRGLGQAVKRAATGVNDNRRNEIAKLMFNPDPSANDQTLLRLASPEMVRRLGTSSAADLFQPRIPTFFAGLLSGRGSN